MVIDDRMTFAWVFNWFLNHGLKNQCPVNWEQDSEKFLPCGGTLLNNYCGRLLRRFYFCWMGGSGVF